MKNPYIKFVLQNAPRLLSQIDRDPDSPTYGCCDRNFWHYKIRDFPSAILQQAGLGLALLYANDFKGNIYYKKEEIKKIAIATVIYWTKIQHRDGSFDEYWPNEHGFPPTCFSLYAVCEICSMLDIEDDMPDEIFRAIFQANSYLSDNREKEAVNQQVASVCAMYKANKHTRVKGTEWTSLLKLQFNKLIEMQNPEGWFPEYGGADMSYLTCSLHFMADFYEDTKNLDAKESLKRMIDFLKYFVHPDGSFGGEYGSRNTEYFLPYGFEVATRLNPIAGTMIDKMLEYAEDNIYIDDRYLCHYVFHSYVKALFAWRPRKKVKLPYEKEFVKYFPEAGLIVKSTKKHYLICAANKGGTLAIFDKKKKILNDCGYRIWKRKDTYVSSWQSDGAEVKLAHDRIILCSDFYKVKFHTPSPIQHIGLRCLSIIFGRKLIPFLKKRLISPQKRAPIHLIRDIYFNRDRITIKDIIVSKGKIDKWSSTDKLSMRYCPSSRYFQKSSLYEQDDKIYRTTQVHSQ